MGLSGASHGLIARGSHGGESCTPDMPTKSGTEARFATGPGLMSPDDGGMSDIGRVGLYEVDSAGIVCQALATDGVVPGDVLGAAAANLLPASQRPRFEERLRRAFDVGDAGGFRYDVSKPDGQTRIEEVRITPARRRDDTPYALLAIFDVTDWVATVRRAEQRLGELQSVFETLPDIYFRIRLDGTIIDYKAPEAADLYLPPDEFLGRRIQQLLPDAVSRLWEENLQRLRDGEQGVSYEYELEVPAGPQVFEARINALPGSDDTVVVVRNITARRSVENQLKESNQRLEEAQSVAHIGSWTYDVALDRATWSTEVYRIFGVDPTQFVPTVESVGRLMHPDDRSRYFEKVERWVSGDDAGSVELRILRPDGVDRVLSSRARAVCDASGRVARVVGTIQDVTESMRMEQALRASEELFRHTIHMSWDMIVLVDAQTRATFVNRAVERTLGYSLTEIVGTRALDLVHPDDLHRAEQILAQLIEDPARPVVAELRLRHRSGGWRWVEFIARNLLDDPSLASIVTNIRDVTDRKLAEEEMKAQEHRFRALIENSADAIALVSPQGDISYASASTFRVMGCAPDELQGLSLLDFVSPESKDEMRASLAAALRAPGTPVAISAEALRPDGRGIRLEGQITNLLDEPGVDALVFNYRDVTERVRQREALEQAHREADMFRRMVDFATQAIGTADLDARVLYQNPALLRLLNIPSLEVAGQHTYEDFYLPEDLEYLRREVIAKVMDEGHWTGEMRLKPLGREPVHTIHNVYLVRDDDGTPVMLSNVVTDISRQKAAEHALRSSESKYRQLFEGALDGVAVADAETGELLDCNPALCRMVDRAREEVIGQPQRILHRPEETLEDVSRTFEAHRSGQEGQLMDAQLITASGELVDVEIMASMVELDGRRALQAVFRDVTAKKRAEEALFAEKERAQVTLHSIGDAVITTDEFGRVEYLNPVAEQLVGWPLAEAGGRPLDEIFKIHDEQSGQAVDNLVTRCLREGRVIDLVRNTVLSGRDGRQYDIDESAAPIRQADGRILGAVLVFHDVSEIRRLTRKMAYDATHDPLTGLINRREFEERLRHALGSALKFGAQHALCYIDLDQFKIVNDAAGHEAGDELLRQIKALLERTFRDRDTLARLGGDEFGLLLDNCPLERAVSIAGAVVNAIREYRFVWQGKGFQIGASVGVTPINRESEGVAGLLSQADVACYTAKDLGRNRVHVYDGNDGAPALRHGEILQAAGLRDALEMDRFRLFCQPIVPLQDAVGVPVHYELLLRLRDGDGELVLPGAFIPAAERFGLMTDLDRWVVRTAFRNYGDVLAPRDGRISINLSGNSLNDESFLDYVRRQFDEWCLPPGRVCFEITETAAIHDLSRAGRLLFELHELGCQVALDDFGSGLSSLRYLKLLPVDFLKIDGGFVCDVDRDPGNHAIVEAVNQLAHNLGIQTIGEYAHSDAIVDTLRSLGVDYAQGFALGHPLPFDTGATDAG